MRKSTTGFTIVELLIVIVVIAILATISVVAYSNIQQRARDSKRASDIAQIKKALLAYDAIHGGVVRPGATGYTKPSGENAYGGFDVSTSAVWLIFLRGDNGRMPVDPVNAIPSSSTTDPFAGDNRQYIYFCYDAGNASGLPGSSAAVVMYRKDSGAQVVEKVPVTTCLTAIPTS
jgi:prepilin-type N-terminal cleavage/methylation domain-containing protein